MVKWRLTEHDGLASLEAVAPQTLVHQTWRLPIETFRQPRVVQGAAGVVADRHGWLVVAGEGKQLKVEARSLDK